MKYKRGFEFSFAWLFAIIVGVVIIFLAIYTTVSFVRTAKIESNTKTAAQLEILLHPIETNLESGRYVEIGFSAETRVYNYCRETGNFGRQGISTSVKSGIGEEWARPGVESSFYNKYIFSEKIEQGKKLNVFVKPFEMPYKIGDLIFMSSRNYCFVNPSSEIEEEILELGLKYINISQTVESCSSNAVSVCFSDLGCDVEVNLLSKTVTKNGQAVYYVGDLIYGAIFSDPEIYECQVKRLMKRAGELAHLYAVKTEFLSGAGCSSNLKNELISYAGLSKINGSENLNELSFTSEELRRKNELLSCKLF